MGFGAVRIRFATTGSSGDEPHPPFLIYRRQTAAMRQPRIVLLCLAALLAGADLAAALNFGLFQHGGRAMGQVGAFTARASEPSAVTYNPAAITQLEGLQTQAGLDFNNADDEYKSSTES